MRLWHEDLIGHLPRPQLLGQHRECCALRGNGWGKKHATVDYVFSYSPYVLYQYHTLIMDECAWTSPLYKEHDDAYYQECIENLAQKGIILEGENHV